MAAVAPPASDQAADLLQKLSLESQTKTIEVTDATKKSSGLQRGSVDGKEANGTIHPTERSTTPMVPDFTDPTMCYYPSGYPSTAYYYGGYDGSMNDWDEYPRYVNPDGVDMRQGVYGDNGSLMYHGYGYGPYGPYSPAASPVPAMGHDGQLYGPQQYQYPSAYYQSPTPGSEPYTTNPVPATQNEVSTSFPVDKTPLSSEVGIGNAKVSANGNSNGSMPLRPAQSNSSLNSNGSYGRGAYQGGIAASNYQDPRYGFDGMRSPSWLDSTGFSDGKQRPGNSIFSSFSNNVQAGRNQNQRPVPSLMGLQGQRPTTAMGPTPGYMNRAYPNTRIYGQYGSAARAVTGYGSNGYGSNGYGSRSNAHGWNLSVESKFRPKGRGNGFLSYGNENTDGLNELNRGPRARGFKNQKGFSPVAIAVKGQNIPMNGNSEDKDNVSVLPDREQCNREDFPVKYADAKFYVIKSYSEDDVHKSIKYSVWASTPNGNKKLDSGYQEAQEKSGGCPVFLFFSVNTSGQFVGLAEMVGPVDFIKNLEYWQQDKWNGCFPVKWHMVKDVPNSSLKHITLENNENKPVTNSRDTQEVKLEQGLQMLKIFKEYSSKTCILDDFGFYEARQKTVQEKKAKSQIQKQMPVVEGKTSDAALSAEKEKEGTNARLRLQSPLDITSALPKEPATVVDNGDHKHSEDNEVKGVRDAPRGPKTVLLTEKRILTNGIAHGC